MTQVPNTLKAIPAKELKSGDKIVLTDPDGVGRVTSTRKASWIKTEDGPCVDLEWEIVSGPNAGQDGYAIVGQNDQVEVMFDV